MDSFIKKKKIYIKISGGEKSANRQLWICVKDISYIFSTIMVKFPNNFMQQCLTDYSGGKYFETTIEVFCLHSKMQIFFVIYI